MPAKVGTENILVSLDEVLPDLPPELTVNGEEALNGLADPDRPVPTRAARLEDPPPFRLHPESKTVARFYEFWQEYTVETISVFVSEQTVSWMSNHGSRLSTRRSCSSNAELREDALRGLPPEATQDALSMTALPAGRILHTMEVHMTQERPNILFIMSDDHASMAMSCYGSYRNQTPHLDRIAADGMRLDNCFCTNSICTPSRASILTGLYAHRNGSIVFNAPDPTCVTFPQMLRNSGYYTAMIGKWHLHSEPVGFDRWAVLPGQGRYYDPIFVDQGVTTTVPGYVTDVTTDMTIATLEERPMDKPFCVLCHHKAPHDPWEPHPRHESLFPAGSIAEPDNLFDDYSGRARAVTRSTQRIGSADPGHTLYPEETSDIADPGERMRAQYQLYMQRYLRCVTAIDEGVGRLLDYLDAQGLSENTIVIYTSDQGFFLGEHGWYDKRFMYEESLRMPFVVRYPAGIEAGGTDDHLILNTDFAATLLDFAQLDPAPGMQSRSFRSILEGDSPSDWRDAFYYRYYYSHFRTPAHWGVRTDRHKLIYYHATEEWELYDLANDPMEMNNLAGSREHAGLMAQLRARLSELKTEVDDQEDGAEGDRRAARLMARPGHPMH